MMRELEQYISRNESAVRKLFSAINEYSEELHQAKIPVYIQDGDSEFSEQAYSEWLTDNKDLIEKRRNAERFYLEEAFALSNLCGAVLQSAAVTIRKFSAKKPIPNEFRGILDPKSPISSYCIGRKIRNVNLGMIIYAGRNQYNHFEDGRLKNPSASVFDLLKKVRVETIDEGGRHEYFCEDPAFDLNTPNLECYAHNILGLIGWKSYEDYRNDLLGLFYEIIIDPVIEEEANRPNSFGTNPLWEAVIPPFDELAVRDLLRKGADPTELNSLGNSVLSMLRGKNSKQFELVINLRNEYLEFIGVDKNAEPNTQIGNNMRGEGL